jgi:small nuclear ribonucleoprotein (snRNP)-like protein
MSRSDRLLRRNIRKRYLVTTTTEETFSGVLVDHDEQHLVLADAKQVAISGEQLEITGQLWLPRPAIKYMQTINP